MNPANSHCELFFLLRSVKQSLSSCSTPVKQPRKGSVLGFQPYEPYELHELNKHSFLATEAPRYGRVFPTEQAENATPGTLLYISLRTLREK